MHAGSKALRAAVGGAAALVVLGAAVPWAGWYGVRSSGLVFAAASAAALVLALVTGRRRAATVAVGAALLACLLLVRRLAVPAPNPQLEQAQADGAVAVLLLAAVLLAGLGLLVRRAPLPPVRPLLSPSVRVDLAAVLRPALLSRAVVWAAGLAGVASGIEPTITRPPLTMPFGSVGDFLLAPATAWDASNYLTIAQVGYAAGPHTQAFFPLYPVAIRFGSWSPEAAVIAGVLISLLAFVAALVLLRRLIRLDFDEATADRTILLVALSPMAFFFSAIYTESMFLLLSVAALYAARRERWAWAAIAAGLACTTRPTGLVLIVPLLALYLYGPGRLRLAAIRAAAPTMLLRLRDTGWADARWLLLVPAGIVAYFAYCAVHGDLLAPLHAQSTYWHREFSPLTGIVHGAVDTATSLHQLSAGPGARILDTPSFQMAGQLSDPMRLANANLTDFSFLVFGCIATVGALRQLPAAYGLYALATVVVAASTSYPYEPLASFPRFLLVAFPCQLWLAIWARTRRRRRIVIGISVLLLVGFSARFAAWQWVA